MFTDFGTKTIPEWKIFQDGKELQMKVPDFSVGMMVRNYRLTEAGVEKLKDACKRLVRTEDSTEIFRILDEDLIVLEGDTKLKTVIVYTALTYLAPNFLNKVLPS